MKISNKSLHITNGSVLTNILKELEYQGDFLTWEEMLCEGPTVYNINSDEFLKLRADFFNTYYEIDLNLEEIKDVLNILDNTEDYSEIILWFEYDLFCHINMIGIINLIHQKQIDLPIYLVSSGRIAGEKNLKGLGELTPNQLRNHYNKKVKLTNEDIDLAISVWDIYCGKDHNLLKPYIVKSSNFKYLNNCLKAHLERFPDSVSGLNILEKNILEIIKEHDIKTINQLLGYAINYQGYYGYGNLQFERLIENLSMFFTENKNGIKLNRKGFDALLGRHNFAVEINTSIQFGGINKLEYQFNKQENKLVKTIPNVN